MDVAAPPAPSPAAVAATLLATPRVLRAWLAPVDDATLRWRPSPESWCVKEVIGHLISADRHAFADRIATIVDEDGTTLKAFDVGASAAARADVERPIDDLLDELANGRAVFARFVGALPAAALPRAGRLAPWGDFLAADFLYEWPFHDHDHLAQIAAILRAAIRPYFSETMRDALED